MRLRVKRDAVDDLVFAIENNVIVFAPWLGVMAAAGFENEHQKNNRARFSAM